MKQPRHILGICIKHEYIHQAISFISNLNATQSSVSYIYPAVKINVG